MTKLDSFESAFKSADKPVYAYARVEFERVLVVTDLSDVEAAALLDQVRTFLAVLGEDPQWRHLGGADFASVGTLLEQIEAPRDDPRRANGPGAQLPAR